MLSQYGFTKEIFDQVIEFLKKQVEQLWTPKTFSEKSDNLFYDYLSCCNRCLVTSLTCGISSCLHDKKKSIIRDRLRELQVRFETFIHDLQKNMRWRVKLLIRRYDDEAVKDRCVKWMNIHGRIRNPYFFDNMIDDHGILIRIQYPTVIPWVELPPNPGELPFEGGSQVITDAPPSYSSLVQMAPHFTGAHTNPAIITAEPKSEGKKFCGNCGSKRDGKTFCGDCGFRF